VLEGLQQLLELQRLDSEITRREELLAEIPSKRRQFEASLESASAKLEAARENLQAAELAQRNAEAALQDHEALLQKLEGQQLQVKDNVAYSALLREMEHAKQAISACETTILEAMEAIEKNRAALTAAESEDRETRASVESGHQEIDAREKQAAREQTELGSERALVGPRLDPKMLALYERVARSRRPALALVSNEVCGGCRVGIPAQNYIEILKGERLITCGNCRRILLHSDMVSSAGGVAPGSENPSETPV
jgi:predicted  nucleic acid-binding Zn-ribbon protein